MYPPVSGLLAKQVPPEGDTISVDGVPKHVPGGVEIAWNSWGMGHDTAVFGADADIFRPERWQPKPHPGPQHSALSAAEWDDREAARIERMEGVQGMVFGSGRFGCLGKPVALTELGKAVPELLMRFHFQVMNPARPFTGVCTGFFLHENMWMRVTPREDDRAPPDRAAAKGQVNGNHMAHVDDAAATVGAVAA